MALRLTAEVRSMSAAIADDEQYEELVGDTAFNIGWHAWVQPQESRHRPFSSAGLCRWVLPSRRRCRIAVHAVAMEEQHGQFAT